VRSPDASLLRLERWHALSPAERRSFAPLCPDLVVELASPSDEGPRGVSALRQKMAAYQANGARLGWLLLPHERAVEVWGPAHQEARNQEANQEEPRRLEQAATLEGGAEFPGLFLNLEEIWAG
jgi:Uma2 family endonuclease